MAEDAVASRYCEPDSSREAASPESLEQYKDDVSDCASVTLIPRPKFGFCPQNYIWFIIMCSFKKHFVMPPAVGSEIPAGDTLTIQRLKHAKAMPCLGSAKGMGPTTGGQLDPISWSIFYTFLYPIFNVLSMFVRHFPTCMILYDQKQKTTI